VKKVIYGLFAVIIILAMFWTGAPSSVSAKANETTGVDSGEWSRGTLAVIDLAKTAYPTYLQLMDENSTTITKPGPLCHNFRGGSYGWTAEIRELVKDTWKKLPTTMQWVPDKEGVYTACAQATAAGTYALFGYFDPAKAPKQEAAVETAPACAYFSGYASGNEGEVTGLSISVPGAPAATDVDWALTNLVNIVPGTDITGTTATNAGQILNITLPQSLTHTSGNSMSVTITVPGGCTANLEISFY